MKPSETPIGLLIAQTAKAATRAFDESLSDAGGSTSSWLILMSLIRGGPCAQSDLATTVGVRGPTLTYHLNSMEKAGLLARIRREDNRRVHDVTLTDAGRARFHQMRQAAATHDARLQKPFTQEELVVFRDLLNRLAKTVAEPATARPSISRPRQGGQIENTNPTAEDALDE